jgi:hypothetical protein
LAVARAAQGSMVLSVVLTGFCRYSCNDKHVSDTTLWVAKRIPNVSHVMVVRIQVTTIMKEKNLVHLRNVDTSPQMIRKRVVDIITSNTIHMIWTIRL